MGWCIYRIARYRDAGDDAAQLADQHDSDYEPQALYWMGRAAELSQQPHARDVYVQLCQRYVYTYYCQLARERIDIPSLEPLASEPISPTVPVNGGTNRIVRPRARCLPGPESSSSRPTVEPLSLRRWAWTRMLRASWRG